MDLESGIFKTQLCKESKGNQEGSWILGYIKGKVSEKKNKYLSAGDNNHPSFICYVEAINDLHNELRQKKKIK